MHSQYYVLAERFLSRLATAYAKYQEQCLLTNEMQQDAAFLLLTRLTTSTPLLIHSAVCLMTGPMPPPKRFLHIVRFKASPFK